MEKKLTIAIASDHAGYSLKEEIKKLLDSPEQTYPYRDFGTNNDQIPVHYPKQ